MQAVLRCRDFARRHAQWLGLLALFLVVNFQYAAKISRTDGSPRSAFNRWALQLGELRDGVDIWAKHNYPNPPIMALLLTPFTLLPAQAGPLAWFYFKAACAILSIFWVLRMLDESGPPLGWWGKAAVVLLAWRPIQSDLTHGNVNLFILLLLVACWRAYSCRRDFLAGLVLALAIACKLTPALFIPYFAWKRSWRLLGGCMAGLVLSFLVIPGLWLGPIRNIACLQSWVQAMIVPFVVGGEVTSEHINQSLPGLAERLLTRSPSFLDFDWQNNAWVPLEYHNVAALPDAWIRVLLKACLVLFVFLVVMVCRTPTADRNDWRHLAEASIILLGMLLFSERTWKHHCVVLLIPFGVMVSTATRYWHRPGVRNYLLGMLAAVALLMLSTSTGLVDRHDRFGKLAQTYGAYVWAFLLLLAALALTLRRTQLETTPTTDLCYRPGTG